MLDVILMIIAAALVGGGITWRKKVVALIPPDTKPSKKLKHKRTMATMLVVIGIYMFLTRMITMIFGKPESKGINVALGVDRVYLFGHNLSTTMIYTWIIMALLVCIAIILRITVVPHMEDVPKGAQNVVELVVEFLMKYTDDTAPGVGDFMGSYIITIVVFLLGCAFIELFGVRTPAADLTLTGAMAILTFLFINIYGFKRNGVIGRIKKMAGASPMVFPIKVVTDCAVPVSLACRLFGNMLGGMIVMDLLYMALGNNAIGIPSVIGLFFNVFHPVIQAFIFVTLTLTFINEAIE